MLDHWTQHNFCAEFKGRYCARTSSAAINCDHAHCVQRRKGGYVTITMTAPTTRVGSETCACPKITCMRPTQLLINNFPALRLQFLLISQNLSQKMFAELQPAMLLIAAFSFLSATYAQCKLKWKSSWYTDVHEQRNSAFFPNPQLRSKYNCRLWLAI